MKTLVKNCLIPCFLLLFAQISAQRVGIETLNPDSTLSIQNKLEIGGSQGDVVFTDDEGSITFPSTAAPNTPMIHMFASGTTNADRMVIAHSPNYTDWGLQYRDGVDQFHFLGEGNEAMGIDLGAGRVAIGDAALSAAFTLNVQSDQEDRTAYFFNDKNSTATTYGIYAGSFGTGSGDKRGGAFDASGGTGTNIAVRGFAQNGNTNIGVYGLAQGGTTNWAAHFDAGDVIIDDFVGIGTNNPLEQLHLVQTVVGSQLRMEAPNGFVDFYSTNSSLANGMRFYEDGAFDGGMFYEPDMELLNISHSANQTGLSVSLAASPSYRVNVGGNMIIEAGEEASLSSDGYLQTGQSSGLNIVMDNNEITARNNGLESALFLQPNQGNVSIGLTSDLGACLNVDGNAGQNAVRFRVDGTTRFVIDQDGDIIINSVSNKKPGYELNVDGQIVAEEVLVQNSANWPDFVFADDYQLMPLDEVEHHIQSFRHLPGVPSAAEIKEDGILLGEMDKTLMQKVEELTLYMIQQSKEIEQLKQQNEELRKLIDKS